MTTATYDRGTRCSLLAAADPEHLMAVAESILASADDVVVVQPPEVGVVVLEVREPVEATRVQLADVLVTRAEVAIDDVAGWAMRLGDCPAVVLAAAICDAAVERHLRFVTDERSSVAARRVHELCKTTAASVRARDELEWDELAPTMVTFDGIDS